MENLFIYISFHPVLYNMCNKRRGILSVGWYVYKYIYCKSKIVARIVAAADILSGYFYNHTEVKKQLVVYIIDHIIVH